MLKRVQPLLAAAGKVTIFAILGVTFLFSLLGGVGSLLGVEWFAKDDATELYFRLAFLYGVMFGVFLWGVKGFPRLCK